MRERKIERARGKYEGERGREREEQRRPGV